MSNQTPDVAAIVARHQPDVVGRDTVNGYTVDTRLVRRIPPYAPYYETLAWRETGEPDSHEWTYDNREAAVVGHADAVEAMANRSPETSRRDVWLTIAAAVAEGLPEPCAIHLYDRDRTARWTSTNSVARVSVDTLEIAEQWAKHLGIVRRSDTSLKDGSTAVSYDKNASESLTGWSWTISTEIPAPVADASLIVAAALTPDAAELPAEVTE